MPAKDTTRAAVNGDWLLYDYDIVGNSNGLASVADMAVILILYG